MSIVPIIGVRVLLQVLQKAGFYVVRQVGSHLRLENPVTKVTITVPVHAGDLSRKMLMAILRQSRISITEFLKILKM